MTFLIDELIYFKQYYSFYDWYLIINKKSYTEDDFNSIKDNINWEYISSKNLSFKFIDKYINFIKWDIFSNHVISAKYLKKYENNIKWLLVSRNNKLPYYIIKSFSNKINLNVLIRHKQLPINFIKENINKFNLKSPYLYDYDVFDYSFIKEHIKNFDFNNYLLYTQTIDYDILNDYYYKINWRLASKHIKLNKDLIIRHKDKVIWKDIFEYQKLDESFIDEYKVMLITDERFLNTFKNPLIKNENFKNNLKILLTLKNNNDIIKYITINNFDIYVSAYTYIFNNKVSNNYLENFMLCFNEIIKKLQIQSLSNNENISKLFDVIFENQNLHIYLMQLINNDNNNFNYFNSKLISENKSINESFIDDYKEKLDWSLICKWFPLNVDFINKYDKKINWKSICEFQTLDENFIIKYKNKVDWKLICEFQTLSEQFIIDHANIVNWNSICEHQNIKNIISNELFIKQINFYLISKYQILNHSFIEKYKDKLDFKAISEFQFLKKSFIKKNYIKIDFYSLNYKNKYQLIHNLLCKL